MKPHNNHLISSFRACIQCIHANVGMYIAQRPHNTAKVPSVLRKIGDIYGQQMDPRDIPARTTVERMQIEVVVISDQQVFSIICEYIISQH